jgi:thiamine-phosphate pyrophosphorylase
MDMKGVYLVTDQTSCRHHSLETIVSEAVLAGVSCVQLREKALDTRTFIARAQNLQTILTPTRIPLIINDRVDIALASGADGVHIGQSDMPYELTRNLMGPNRLIGLSVETWEDVVEAQDMDVDYIGVSPVFPTPTKTDTKEPWGLDGLMRIKAYSRHPLVAIGGLNTVNTHQVIKAGADAIAVVSAICSARDPFKAAQALCTYFKHTRPSHEERS